MEFKKLKIFEGEKKIGIILVHGWTANPNQVNELSKMLNEVGYWVFNPLLPGHGTRPENLEKMKWQVWLDDLIKTIDFVKKDYRLEQVFVGGVSLGGNLSLLASLERKVDGVILMATPIHLKNHISTWVASNFVVFFKKYLHKNYLKNTKSVVPLNHSYRYFPLRSAGESLKAMKKSASKLKKVTAPVLILQTNSDYLVAKYSPWVIYNRINSKIKKLQWIQSRYESHTLTKEETKDFFVAIHNFLLELESTENNMKNINNIRT